MIFPVPVDDMISLISYPYDITDVLSLCPYKNRNIRDCIKNKREIKNLFTKLDSDFKLILATFLFQGQNTWI